MEMFIHIVSSHDWIWNTDDVDNKMRTMIKKILEQIQGPIIASI